MAHCMPVLVKPSSVWMWGAAIATIVWSMKVIDTAKIIAARTRFLDRPTLTLVPTMTRPPPFLSYEL